MDVVDSLVVTLGLDASNYRAGSESARKDLNLTRDVASRTAKEMEASGKQAAQFYAQVKTEALGLIGVLLGAGGIAAFTEKTTQSLIGLGNAAANIQMPVQQLSAFQQVVERNGGSAESATSSFQALAANLEKLKLGLDPSLFPWLTQIGASPEDGPFGIFVKFVKFADEHKDDQRLVNLVGTGLGFDQSLINAARHMGDVASFQRQMNEEMHRSATKEQADDALKLAQAWSDLSHEAIALGRALLDDLNPHLIPLLEWGKDEIEQHGSLVEALFLIAGGLTAIKIASAGMSFLGFKALAELLASIVPLFERLVPLLLPLALKGDTGPNQGELPPEEQQKIRDDAAARGIKTPGQAISDIWDNRPSWLRGSGGGGGGPPTAGSPAAAVAQRTHDFWRAQGFTEEQVAGILAGGPGAESGFDPSAIGDNGTSYGLYQHHADRWAAMQLRYGTKYPTEQQQNEYAAWEISPQGPLANVGSAIHAARNAQEATNAFTGGFEKPADPAAGLKRGRFAGQYVGRYDANPTNMPPPIAKSGNAPLPGKPASSPDIRIDPALLPQPGASAPITNTTSTSSSSNSVQIDQIHVHTQATDATGISRDIRKAMDDSFVQQANRGLQ